MQVKVFVQDSRFRKHPTALFDGLEAEINTWLGAKPNIVVEHAHQLSRPSFDWGQPAVAVWYTEAEADTTAN